MTVKMAILVAGLLVNGCAMMSQSEYARTLTVGHVGCREREITIANLDVGPMESLNSWEATCRGALYFCSKRSDFGDVVRCVKDESSTAKRVVE